MAEKIKVYLQSPWKNTDSAYYKNLRDNPPEGIEYVNSSDFKLIQSKKKRKINNWLKKLIKRSVNKLVPTLTNSHKTKISEYDLIHCTHCLSKNKGPWVGDFESIAQFWVARNSRNSGKKKIEKILAKDNCKRIMAWNEFVSRQIKDMFPAAKDKVEIVYPAAASENRLKKIKHKKITLVYAARDFYIKGGLIALETLNGLVEEKGIEAIVVSDVPNKIMGKYHKIKFTGLLSQKKLFEIFRKSDIFFYPSLSDTFGFALLEAMSFGLPVVGINTRGTPSIKDILGNGKRGIIVEFPHELRFKKMGIPERELVSELISKTGKLIDDKKRMKEMTKNCLEEIKKGKFSVRERNKRLKKIYFEAVNGA